MNVTMKKKLLYVFLFFSINIFAQSQNYLEVTGQWKKVDSLSCFPEILTIGQDNYFVWLREGDPCSIYTEYGQWSFCQDTLILTSKVILHDEYGNGKYLTLNKKNTEKYVLILKNKKLYVIGKYTKVNKKVKYIDYNVNKLLEDSSFPYFVIEQ